MLPNVDLTQTLFEVIDMRSFSNLWFWIMLALIWSAASHRVLGVPFDMVVRARRFGGQSERDLIDMVRININRMLHLGHVAGSWLIGVATFGLSSLSLLAFWYDIEFAQAVVLILLPLSIVAAMSFATARRIAVERPEVEALCRHLARHRFWVQLLGMVSIFVTAMYGMYQNLSVAPGF
ncbi:MAG: component of SufBCD complex [Limimaricola soesokkakensis]|uniref:component of SufBCD complex n=1 Tax=Limimaricola soesokkakensis TaxID=1343159 RepID=UPI003513FC75